MLLSLAATLSTCHLTPAQAVHETRPAAPVADMLTLSVDGRSLQLTPADLAAMPQITVRVSNGHAKIDEQYTGVALTDLLVRAGISLAPGAEQRLYHSYLRVQGTDQYFVLYSGTELIPALHKGNVIVALKRNGQPLAADGRFRMVATDDTRPARWVRNLTSLTFTTVN